MDIHNIEPCEMCGQEVGGSHYHCGNCGEESSMLGHLVDGKFKCEKKDVEWPESWEMRFKLDSSSQ